MTKTKLVPLLSMTYMWVDYQIALCWLYIWYLDVSQHITVWTNGCHSGDDVIRCILIDNESSIWIQISMKIVPMCSTENIIRVWLNVPHEATNNLTKSTKKNVYKLCWIYLNPEPTQNWLHNDPCMDNSWAIWQVAKWQIASLFTLRIETPWRAFDVEVMNFA